MIKILKSEVIDQRNLLKIFFFQYQDYSKINKLCSMCDFTEYLLWWFYNIEEILQETNYFRAKQKYFNLVNNCIQSQKVVDIKIRPKWRVLLYSILSPTDEKVNKRLSHLCQLLHSCQELLQYSGVNWCVHVLNVLYFLFKCLEQYKRGNLDKPVLNKPRCYHGK